MNDNKEPEIKPYTIHNVVCCGVLEKMNLGWMKLEDGTKCMPYIKGRLDELMYRVNNCPSSESRSSRGGLFNYRKC